MDVSGAEFLDEASEEMEESNTPPLFSMRRTKKWEYWSCVKLIAPSDEKKAWSSKDAVGAWCCICKERLTFSRGNINSVVRHVDKFHPELVERYLDNPDPSKRSRSAEDEGSIPDNIDDMPTFAHLLPPNWKSQIQSWLQDDIPSFDIGGMIVGERPQTAILFAKSPGVLAGVPFFNAVFEAVGCTVDWTMNEGEVIETDSKIQIATVAGPCRMILLGERTALNILTRASGIATQAKEAVDLARSEQWFGHVAGTRKTTPGFRLVEKYALLVAGASTHRHDLSQMVMLKDNHIWSAGSISNAVLRAKVAAGFSTKIEVECQSKEEAIEAAAAGADIVMLDNFAPEDLKRDAALLKEQFPYLLIEASGGITPATMSNYLSPHVDVISQGRLTQGYPCLDFSLKIKH